MRRLLKKEVSLDTYTWQKKYGHLTSNIMMAAVDERLKRRFSVSASMEEISKIPNQGSQVNLREFSESLKFFKRILVQPINSRVISFSNSDPNRLLLLNLSILISWKLSGTKEVLREEDCSFQSKPLDRAIRQRHWKKIRVFRIKEKH